MHTAHRRASKSQQDQVWRTLVERQIEAVQRGMSREFLAGLELAQLDPARMPRHRELSTRLASLCGWRIETVPGLIPARDFFELLRDRRFPSPEWIRHPDDLEYTPAPDAFHDLFGHVPQLASAEYCAILEELAAAARGASDVELLEIERVYWFTIEFGLVQQGPEVRAMGAGLASSIAELDRSLHDPAVRRRAFLLHEARRENFQSDRPQELYLVSPGFVPLAASLSDLGSANRRRAG